MKIFWTDEFEGFWPVGSAAVVVDANEELARKRLDTELKGIGLKGLRPTDTLHEIPLEPDTIIINDGNY